MISMSVLSAATHAATYPTSTRPNNNTGNATQAASLLARWLAQALDQVGRGMLLVTETGRVLHANRLARADLEGSEAALVLEHGHLRGRTAAEALPLAEALANAGLRGLRRLLTLGAGPRPMTVAVLPLDASHEGGVAFDDRGGDGPRAVLVSLPQSRQAAQVQDLSLSCYARQHGFTAAETAVLQALLEGRMPSEIARAKGVQLSTVRTQIGQLRVKTGARSIRDLLDRVATLPPMMAVLQS
jgi:DNA-binding CsgD family transcriptional regulator